MADMLITVSILIAVLALIVASVRFFKGPDVIDRVIAFDVLTIISISLIVSLAHIAERVIYLDVAIVYGLLSFLGVIIVARYMERGL